MSRIVCVDEGLLFAKCIESNNNDFGDRIDFVSVNPTDREEAIAGRLIIEVHRDARFRSETRRNGYAVNDSQSRLTILNLEALDFAEMFGNDQH